LEPNFFIAPLFLFSLQYVHGQSESLVHIHTALNVLTPYIHSEPFCRCLLCLSSLCIIRASMHTCVFGTWAFAILSVAGVAIGAFLFSCVSCWCCPWTFAVFSSLAGAVLRPLLLSRLLRFVVFSPWFFSTFFSFFLFFFFFHVRLVRHSFILFIPLVSY